MSDWEEITDMNDEMWDYKQEFEKAGKPDDGVTFVGMYQGNEENVGPNNSMLYEFKTDAGTVKIWGNTLLDNRFKNLEKGEAVKIIYLGMAKGDRGPYHNFRVFHKKLSESDMNAALDESEKRIDKTMNKIRKTVSKDDIKLETD